MSPDQRALRRCVGDPEAFLTTHWGRAPFLSRGKPGDHSDLASLAIFDQVISGHNLRTPAFRMVQDGDTLPPGGYTRAAGSGKRATEGIVDPGAMYQRFAAGATIVLEGLHKQWPPLATFCRELEESVGHPFQVNAYITPKGSQGFVKHSDDHDVFVLQVFGSKDWSVWDREDSGGVLLFEEAIRDGDCLYIPDGFPHAARTADEASAHLTVGALTSTRAQLAEELLRSGLAQSSSWKERLPAGIAGDAELLRAESQAVLEELRKWVTDASVDDVLPLVARRFLTSKQQVPYGRLEQLVRLDELDDETVLRKRVQASVHLFDGGESLRMLLDDRELALPAWVRPALEFATTRESFAVRELEPFLDAESRLVLCRRLVREGLLLARLD